MTQQTISENWKIIQFIWDIETRDIVEKETVLGRYTKQAAVEEIEKKYPEYKFKIVGDHGFGGYWLNHKNGDTIDLVPCFVGEIE